MGYTAGTQAYLGTTPVQTLLNNDEVFFNTFTQVQEVYQWRNDPYSSSLVLALPMSQFSTLGMTDYKQDVSALIKGVGSNVSLATTGSNLFASSSVCSYSTASWSDNGYTNSGFVGLSSLYGAPSTTTCNFGSSNFVIEAWVLLPPSSIGGLYNSTVFGHNSGDYLLADISPFGNTIRFYINGAGTPQGFSWVSNTWYHLAYVRTGNNFYSYVNGSRRHNFTVTGAVSNSPDGFWRLLGYASNDETVPKTVQDFRLYIGTDKGYTGATITPPMPIVEKTLV